jgi:adenylate cyclase
LRRFRSYLIGFGSGVIGGIAFPIYLYGLIFRPAFSGAIIGVFISMTITFFEIRYLQDWLRRMRFSFALVIRTAVQITIIVFYVLIGLFFYDLVYRGTPFDEVLRSDDLHQFLFDGGLLTIVLYSLTVLFLINMIRQMSRILGQNVLLNMLAGKYIKPIEEERVFMFLDLDASTTHAEHLGNIRYHELLDEYVYDITKPIVEWNGEIYQYVGDEVVVTWKSSHVKKTIDPIDCFFAITKTMDDLAVKYKSKYGFVPGFKAGFHYGRVVTGEIGDIKKEIVFQGDVVNTASRIKETCSSLGAKILVSRELLEALPKMDLKYRALRAGSFLLKGKEHEVELFSVIQVNGNAHVTNN